MQYIYKKDFIENRSRNENVLLRVSILYDGSYTRCD